MRHFSACADVVMCCMPALDRIMAEYQARIAAEGEYDDTELPGSLVDELEAGQGEDRRTFAVSM